VLDGLCNEEGMEEMAFSVERTGEGDLRNEAASAASASSSVLDKGSESEQ